MEIFLSFLYTLKEELVAFSDSGLFLFLKIIIGVYVLVVFIDIVLMLFQRGLMGDIRDTVFGMNIPKDLIANKSKIDKKWNKIRARMKSDNESEYKVAVIEADNLIDDLVKKLGYPGENLGERMENMPETEIEAKIDLVQAHEVRNRIIHDENFVLDKNKAQETLENYENFLKYFQVLD